MKKEMRANGAYNSISTKNSNINNNNMETNGNKKRSANTT